VTWHLAQRSLRDSIDRYPVIGDGQRRLLGIMNLPENDRIHIHRDRVLGECLLGIEGGGLDPAVDDRIRD
jgi:hypothetical protein